MLKTTARKVLLFARRLLSAVIDREFTYGLLKMGKRYLENHPEGDVERALFSGIDERWPGARAVAEKLKASRHLRLIQGGVEA